MVEVVLNGEVLCTGELNPTAPYMFWHSVVVSSETDRDALVEKLQASNARWEGYLNVGGNYVLWLPPIFKVNKIQTIF